MEELDFKRFGIVADNVELENRLYGALTELQGLGDLRLRAAWLYYGSIAKAAKAFGLKTEVFRSIIEPLYITHPELEATLHSNKLDRLIEANFAADHIHEWMLFEDVAKLIESLPDAERSDIFRGGLPFPKTKEAFFKLITSWEQDQRLTQISAAVEMIRNYLGRWNLRKYVRVFMGSENRYMDFRQGIEDLTSISIPCLVASEIYEEYDIYLHHWTETRKFMKEQRIYADSHRLQFMALVAERDGSRECRECGSTEDIVLDHIHAVALGGRSEIDNFQLLCFSCNSKKAKKERAMIHSGLTDNTIFKI